MGQDRRERLLGRASKFVAALEHNAAPFVAQVSDGPFVQRVLAGTFPLDGIRFVHLNHYHLIVNDMANLNVWVAKARSEEEMLFFHSMAVEEKNHLDSVFFLNDGLGVDPQRLRSFKPHSKCLLRTNYFSRLAQYGTAGELALAILLNFPVWAAGAKREAEGLKRHYGLGRPAPGSDRLDTDILDRFEGATVGFRENALLIVGTDLESPGSSGRLRRAGMWSAHYEAMVWQAYHDEGLRYAREQDSSG